MDRTYKALQTAQSYIKDLLESLDDQMDLESIPEYMEIKDALDFQEGFFPITSVHRADLEDLGFDTSNVSDQRMERIAEKMADDYCNQLFHTSLEIIADDQGVPRQNNFDIDQVTDILKSDFRHYENRGREITETDIVNIAHLIAYRRNIDCADPIIDEIIDEVRKYYK